MGEYIYLAGISGTAKGNIYRIGPKPHLHEWRYDRTQSRWRLIAKMDDPWWGSVNRRVTDHHPDLVPVAGDGIDELGTEEGQPWPH